MMKCGLVSLPQSFLRPTLDSKSLCTFHYDVTYNIPTHCFAPFISFFILWYVATKFSQKRYQVRQRYKWGPKEWVLLCLTFLLCYNNEQGSKILNFLQKHLIFFHIMTLTMRGNELRRVEILFMSLKLQNILLQHKWWGSETSLKMGTNVYHFKSFSYYIHVAIAFIWRFMY